MSTNVGNLNRLVPGLLERIDSAKTARVEAQQDGEGKFTELFTNMLNSVNDIQTEAAQLKDAMLAGEPVELHQVMIKAEEAGIATDLLLEIRNKLLSAYTELMRMPM